MKRANKKQIAKVIKAHKAKLIAKQRAKNKSEAMAYFIAQHELYMESYNKAILMEIPRDPGKSFQTSGKIHLF